MDRLGYLLFCCLLASIGFGQSLPPTAEELHKELVALIRANSYRVELRDGQLSGPGADRLLQAARSSQFLVLAEEHYVREIPQITTALLRQLQPAGYNYLAIESATVQARIASALPLRGNRRAIFDFTRTYPFSLTFFSDQEVEMIAGAGSISRGKGNAVWGIDQEFGATHVLERLWSHAPTAEARQYTQELLERARQYENAANRADWNDNNHFMAAVAKPDDFIRLRDLYAAAKQADVKPMIEALIESSTIFNHYRENRGYLNSSTRERYMKDVFMAEYRRAERLDGRAPRVIVKAGHWHALKGMNRAAVFTLGNFLSEFAYGNGLDSVHVSMHVHGPEGHWREIRKSEAMKLFAEATPPDQITMVDLRAMRPLVARRAVRAVLPRETVSQFFEADALLILGGAQPATTSELVKE